MKVVSGAHALYLSLRKNDYNKMIVALRNTVVDTGFAVKPGCKTLPMTPTDRPSRKIELVAWCNNLASSLGAHDDPLGDRFNSLKPGYHCTKENFGVKHVPKVFTISI